MKNRAIITLLIQLIPNLASAQTTNWTWVNPSPTGNHLLGASFRSPLDGYAVGLAGTVLRTANGGISWETLALDRSSDLFSVHFPEAKTGYCVGFRRPAGGILAGVVFSTVDGGMNWTRKDMAPEQNLRSVWFLDPKVGLTGTWNGEILRTQNGGQDWELVGSMGKNEVEDIRFPAQGPGYAVGAGRLFRSSDAGRTWDSLGVGGYIGAADLSGDSLWYAAGGVTSARGKGLVRKSTDGGTTWGPNLWTDTGSVVFTSLSSASEAGVCVGTGNGEIHSTSDGGAHWERKYRGIDAPITSLRFQNGKTGFAFSYVGLVLSTDDGGATWKELSTRLGLRSVVFASDFPSARVGYVGGLLIDGNSAMILKTSDGGARWDSLRTGISSPIYDLDFTDELRGYLLTGENTLRRTRDGGLTWDSLAIVAPGHCSGMRFPGQDSGWVVSDSGVILRTVNGGGAWATRFVDPKKSFTRIECRATANCLAVARDTGQSYVLATSDGGSTWNSAALGPASLVMAILLENGKAFATGNGLFRSNDGGRSWTRISIPEADTFGPIRFWDDLKGCVLAGRNSFYTVDGGDHWAKSEMPVLQGITALSVAGPNTVFAFGGWGNILKMEWAGTPIHAASFAESEKRNQRVWLAGTGFRVLAVSGNSFWDFAGRVRSH